MAEWVPEGYELIQGTGSYGGLDDRVKRRKKKHPIGFHVPRAKSKPKKRK